MSRLHKKCLVASGFAHGVLLLTVLIGSAFITPEPRIETHTIELVDIPDILVNEEVAGGGNPSSAPPPEPRPIPTPQPRQPEPQVVTPPPEPVRTPEPEVIPEPVRTPVRQPEIKPEPTPPKPKPKPKPPAVKVNLNNKVTAPTEKQYAQAEVKEAAPRFDPNELTSRLSSRLSTSSTTVAIPGPGGAAYASYAAYLRKIYRESWIPPASGSPNHPPVEVEIVVSKTGRVLSAKRIKDSGNVSLDKSVQSTLDRVRILRPLPEGTTDNQRTFRINFNLDF